MRALVLDALRPVLLHEVGARHRLGQRRCHRDHAPRRPPDRRRGRAAASSSSACADEPRRGRERLGARVGQPHRPSPPRAKTMAQERPMRPAPTMAAVGMSSPPLAYSALSAAASWPRRGTRERRTSKATQPASLRSAWTGASFEAPAAARSLQDEERWRELRTAVTATAPCAARRDRRAGPSTGRLWITRPRSSATVRSESASARSR